MIEPDGLSDEQRAWLNTWNNVRAGTIWELHLRTSNAKRELFELEHPNIRGANADIPAPGSRGG